MSNKNRSEIPQAIERRIQTSRWLHRTMLFAALGTGIALGLDYEAEDPSTASVSSVSVLGGLVMASVVDTVTVKRSVERRLRAYQQDHTANAPILYESLDDDGKGPRALSVMTPVLYSACMMDAIAGRSFATGVMFGAGSVLFTSREKALTELQDFSRISMEVWDEVALTIDRQ